MKTKMLLISLVHLIVLAVSVYIGYRLSVGKTTGMVVLYILASLFIAGLVLIPVNMLLYL